MCAQIIPFGAAATVTGTVCHDIPNNRAGLRLAHLRGGRRIVNDRYLKQETGGAHGARARRCWPLRRRLGEGVRIARSAVFAAGDPS
jgi:hypothetical protein